MQTQELQVNSIIAQNSSKTVKEISKLLKEEYGILLSEDAVRGRLRRMASKLELEAAELGVDLSSVSKFWCRGKTATFEVSNSRPNLDSLKKDLDELFKSFDKKKPKVQRKKVKDGHLLVIDPADMHFGKLGRKEETNDDYNLEVSRQRLIEGVNGIVQKSSGFDIEKILVITGNDILHVDNPKRTTTSGTPQDTDGMFWEAYKIAQASLKHCLDLLLEIADVDVMYCPSNHDFMSGFMLIDSLSMAYKSNPNITFDCSMKHRKYYKYGSNLICGTHGDGMKMADMPLVMAEESGMWDSTRFRYCYLHHFHHFKKNNWRVGEDIMGTSVEVLRSASGMDRWTSTNFGKTKKAVEGFIHHANEGQICKLSHFF
jgi:hypothetical protein